MHKNIKQKLFPLVRGTDPRIRILLFSLLTFKMPTKNLLKKSFSAYFFKGTFTSFFKGKLSKKSHETKSRFFHPA